MTFAAKRNRQRIWRMADVSSVTRIEPCPSRSAWQLVRPCPLPSALVLFISVIVATFANEGVSFH